MPANIPSPIVGAGGASRQNPLEALLMSLAHGLAGGLVQRGLDKFMPAPETPQERLRAGAEQYSQQQLMNMPGSEEHTALRGAAATGLGNATVPTSDVVGLSALPRAASTAPERLAMAQEQRRLADEEARKVRLRQTAIKSVPENLRPVMTMMLNAKEAGVDSSSINDLLPQLLPPTEAQLIQQAHQQAQTEEILLGLRQARTDERMRAELAGAIGLTSESVTDGMITEWMQGNRMAAQASDPQQMAERLLTTLISRTVVDPITGQANPAFNIEDAAARTEAGMQMFIPDYRLEMTDAQRQIAEAGGILRAAVAAEKRNNPRLKEAELSDRLQARFLADGAERWPLIPPDRFNELLSEAIKSNLLTGLGG